MPAYAVPEQTFLAINAVKLGRFVCNIKQPHLNYHDPVSKSKPEKLTREGANLVKGGALESSSSYMLELTRILKASLGKRNKVLGSIKTDSFKIYEMGNTTKWFKTVTSEPETRTWLEEAMADGEDIYLVVGYLTVKDAQVRQRDATSESASITATVPISEALTAAGVPSPVNAADVASSVQRVQSDLADAKFDALKEQICSVQYQKVGFKWYNSHTVDHAVLARDGVWKAYRNFRGTASSERLDIVEAVLEDGFPEDDMMDLETVGGDSFVA